MEMLKKRKSRSSRGITALELMVSVVAVGTISSLAIGGFNNTRNYFLSRSLSTQIESALQKAKFESIKRNRDIAVFWDSSSNSILTVEQDDSKSSNCNVENINDTRIDELSVENIVANVKDLTVQGTLATGSTSGIVYRPNGLTGSCSNFGAMGAGTLEVRFSSQIQGAADFNISISTAGRIEIDYI